MNMTYEHLKDTSPSVGKVYETYKIAEDAVRTQLNLPVEWDISNEAKAVELYETKIKEAEPLYVKIAQEASSGIQKLRDGFIGPITISGADAITFVKELRSFDGQQLDDTFRDSTLSRQAVHKYKKDFGAGGLGDLLRALNEVELETIKDDMKPFEELSQAAEDLQLSFEAGLQDSFPNWDRAQSDYYSRA